MEIKKFLDFDGVSYLWEKLSLQDYPNNETLITIINAIDQNKANKEDLVQSDWTQEDSSKLDYIKNKPDEQKALELLMELNILVPAAASDGVIYTDSMGAIYCIN